MPDTAPLTRGTEPVRLPPSAVIVLAGVCAALHVGKLPPALPQLQASLGLGLVEAGFFLSMIQLAGMSLGLLVGLASETVGLKRSMWTGLLILSGASLAGSLCTSLWALLSLRALEGLAFLMVVMPGPSLLRQTVTPTHLTRTLGWWGTYMPMGTALALLTGSMLLGHFGWPLWWQGVGVASALAAGAVYFWVTGPVLDKSSRPAAPASGWLRKTAGTLQSGGPWLISLSFCVYAAQWLAVIGFLPTIFGQAGLGPGLIGLLTATVALVNVAGNVMSGRLLQRGIPAPQLLQWGFAAMALGSLGAFVPWGGTDSGVMLRFFSLAVLSCFGGLIPGTLFSLALRLTPASGAVPATVGFMQQWSALGQFAGPPLVAAVASAVGGWQWTWVVTAGLCVAGTLLSLGIAHLLKKQLLAAPPA